MIPAGTRKRVKRLLKGTRAEWSVVDPLSEMKGSDVIDTHIYHRSPVAQLQINYDIEYYKEAILNWPHNWQVIIEVEFKDPFDVVYYRKVELSKSAPFHNMDDDISEAIEAIFSGANMKQYVTTHMTALIK